jgi:UDP-N-acetylmuramoyl-tripeptide--D-alanyl-D-alanine ligase
MVRYTIDDTARITGGTVIRGDGSEASGHAFADSRQASADGLFFALKGENRDGHEFLNAVMEAGCRQFVISDEKAFENALGGRDGITAVKVDDTTEAMITFAKTYLASLDAKRIGVTGSTGKTSTKDMMYAVSSAKYKTGRNLGNLNTVQGLCMTILGFDPDTEVAILEMGMDHAGEIHELADFIRPNIALMTNIGISHLERLGSRENIFHAKMEIVDYFEKGSSLIISTGKDYLKKENVSHGYCKGAETPEGTYDVVTTGTGEDNDYVISDVRENGFKGITFDITHDGQKQHFALPVMGVHNALNATLAIAAGERIGVSMAEAAENLKKMELTGGRLTVKEGRGFEIIDDTYNASPDSMGAALKILSEQEGTRRVAILGEMYELGSDEKALHRSMGELAKELGIDKVIAIGPLARNIAEGAEGIAEYFETKEEFIDEMDDHIKEGDVVLVKASRGLALEKVVKALTEGADK